LISLLAPGQGSQKPGFMNAWLEIVAYRKDIEIMSDAIKVDLIKHGTVSDEVTIRDTAIAQPLIVAATIASANLIRHEDAEATAGHSVGEVAAGYLSGILNQSDAIQLVNVRAQAMAKAAAGTDTGMAAVLGGDATEVLATLEKLSLTAANYNGAGQIVAAGKSQDIVALSENPPAGSKVIVLSVAGAFHTQYMDPAKKELEIFTQSLSVSDPTKTIWSNHAAERITSGQEYLDLLVGQVANSVRWDLCMSTMVDAGVTAVIELSPAGTLAGLAKRGMQGVEVLALKDPNDIEQANKILERN
jgi:[acyl-carrier-protein] S-malonyltransferase